MNSLMEGSPNMSRKAKKRINIKTHLKLTMKYGVGVLYAITLRVLIHFIYAGAEIYGVLFDKIHEIIFGTHGNSLSLY